MARNYIKSSGVKGLFEWIDKIYPSAVKDEKMISNLFSSSIVFEPTTKENYKKRYDECVLIISDYQKFNHELTVAERSYIEKHKDFNFLSSLQPMYLSRIKDSIMKKWERMFFPKTAVYIERFDRKKFGVSLRNARLNIGYSQEVVAEYFHIGVSSLRNYECGIRVPRIDILLALTRLYKTTIEEMVNH